MGRVLSKTGLISCDQCSILVQVQDYVQVHVHVLQDTLFNFVPFVSGPGFRQSDPWDCTNYGETV